MIKTLIALYVFLIAHSAFSDEGKEVIVVCLQRFQKIKSGLESSWCFSIIIVLTSLPIA